MRSYTFQEWGFEASEPGVTVGEAGLDAFRVSLADSEDSSRIGVTITVWTPSAESLERMPPDPMVYFRATYLGSARPGQEETERVFGSVRVIGQGQTTKIPEPSVLEAYRVQVSEDREIFVGMKRRAWFSKEKADEFFDRIAATLRFEGS